MSREQVERLPRFRSPMFWGVPLIAALAMLLVWGLQLNVPLFLFFNRFGLYTGPQIWSNLTLFGDTLTVLALSLLFVGRRPLVVWALLPATLLGGVVVQKLKDWTDIWRPYSIIPPDFMHVIGERLAAYAFPSGHTTAAFTLAGLLCLQPDVRPLYKGLLLIGAVLVGVSRMAVGAHWPMDVLGGALSGWLLAAVGLWVATRATWGLKAWTQRVIALLLVTAAVVMIFYHSNYPYTFWTQRLIGIGALLFSLPHLARLFGLRRPAQA